jgi:hypothetical protein
MKSQVENLNKLVRETFEACDEPAYNRVIRDIVERLDVFSGTEAMAMLDSAKALINLRLVCGLTGNEFVKQNRRQYVSREISDRAIG